MLRAYRRMQQTSQAPATKALTYLAVYSLLIAAGAEAFDCISITGFNLQCITLDTNNSAISQCLVPPPNVNVSAYKLLCDGNRESVSTCLGIQYYVLKCYTCMHL